MLQTDFVQSLREMQQHLFIYERLSSKPRNIKLIQTRRALFNKRLYRVGDTLP